MRKQSLILFAFLIASLVLGQNTNKFKEGKEPAGFAGMKWGEDISNTEGLKYIRERFKNCKEYTKNETTFWKHPIKNIFYGFRNGKLIYVTVDAGNAQRFEPIIEILNQHYLDSSKQKSDKNFYIKGKISSMVIESCSFDLFSTEMVDKKPLEEKWEDITNDEIYNKRKN